MTVLFYSTSLASGSARVGAARVWVLGGLVFGIPGSTVANLFLLSQPAAAFRKRLPLGWANPILVVEGDEMSRTFSGECMSVGSEGAVSISEGRWSVDRSASLSVGPVLGVRKRVHVTFCSPLFYTAPPRQAPSTTCVVSLCCFVKLLLRR
jgi:hypothetical protein